MNTKQRWLAIGAFALVVAILAERAPEPEDSSLEVKRTVTLASVRSSTKTVGETSGELKLDTLHVRTMAKVEDKDMFPSKSWYVPPPPPPKPKPVPPPPPPPPPPPQAPPLPYSFTGSFQEPGGKLVVYLTKADKLYAVSQGDTLESIYKIENVSSGQMTFMYLPLNIRQNLRIGDLR